MPDLYRRELGVGNRRFRATERQGSMKLQPGCDRNFQSAPTAVMRRPMGGVATTGRRERSTLLPDCERDSRCTLTIVMRRGTEEERGPRLVEGTCHYEALTAIPVLHRRQYAKGGVSQPRTGGV